MSLKIIFLLILFQLLKLNGTQQIIQYIAATLNPPHGCPNYGLCTDVTLTLVNESNVNVVFQYGCFPENCVCVDGVTNSTLPCDTVIDQCSSYPCGSNLYFSCKTGIDSHSCSCQTGYTGDDCSTELDSICASFPCQNGATCVSNLSDYTCVCGEGFFGSDCEYKDVCYNVNCNNGYCTRVLQNSNFYCQCNDGYQGSYCQYSNDLSTPPAMDGCYYYDTISIGSITTKLSDSTMTVNLCNQYAISQSTDMAYLTLCGAWCIVSSNPAVNNSASWSDGDCNKKCGGNSSELCGKLNTRCIVYDVGVIDEDPNPCTNQTLCNAVTGNGICVNWRETTGDGYTCVCGTMWTGSNCETSVDSACTSSPCLNGTCVLDSQFNTFSCSCFDGFVGTNCEYENPCTLTTCLYGGTCTEGSNGDYDCSCLNLYSGKNCDEINRCSYDNPCANGECSTIVNGISPNYVCTCDAGWTGTHCDQIIDYCDPNPCNYNSTCTPYFKGYNCTCLVGLTGANCSTIIDLCVGAWVNGKWLKSPCNTKDDAANCTKGINMFTCSCSEKWTDSLCDLNVLIKDVLIAIYGYVDLNMISLLNDLMQNPSEIKDMVPFITGLLSDSERSSLSWDVQDIFNWIGFEDNRLDLNNDIYKWNDVVLGNCFTFNHREQNFTYLMRSSGKHGGILAFMKTSQDEYAPWYDTAAINVFIHNRNEYVFSESVRYNAQPNAESAINIFTTRYTRLGGKYGKCVKETSEVKNYYYPGSYTTDGCLRTCYQDMIMEACLCMDPRYPKALNATSCQLSERSCVTEASEGSGDPSTWPSCICPLPCSNQEYSVTWAKADFVNLPVSCLMSADITACQTQYLDNLLISIVLPQLDFKIYAETVAMDFNKFLSQLGGQLGVLMGINLVTFIEVAFLMFGVITVCCKKYQQK